MYDLVIRNAWVYDGAGNPPVKGDVAVRDGKIASIRHLGKEAALRSIDAGGLALSPGFVDLHNHLDMAVLGLPFMDSHTTQGVTTSLTGNCGLSMAPLADATRDLARRYLSPFIPSAAESDWKWNSFGDFTRRIEDVGIGHNLAGLVGQGSVRVAVKGFDPSPASESEMEAMKNLLRESLEEGAFGLSSGLIYPPGSFTEDRELEELASVLTEYGALYSTHMRNEGGVLIESVEAALELGRKCRVPVEISHHKATGRRNWGKLHRTLHMMELAREEGIDVCCDIYPYTAGSTTISALLPPFALEGGLEGALKRLTEPEARQQMKQELQNSRGDWENTLGNVGFENILICSSPEKTASQGKTLKELIDEHPQKDSPYEAFFDILLDMRCDATMAIFSMDEEEMEYGVTHPLSSIVSDAWATSPALGGRPHPRAYGTFPRFLRRFALDARRLSLENAIRKITSLPASRIGLSDRGLVKKGCWADLVLFDPKALRDRATYADPHQYPEGIEMVLVNGCIAVERGSVRESKAGRVLRRGQEECKLVKNTTLIDKTPLHGARP
ncbi:MAG: D-aminoacylase [Synergistaceae bacterium]|jgi:N-acyl-D-aspartate/D-glutamate deacylase|nr:D-aminoacylase [Synergistaceae bacterium]